MALRERDRKRREFYEQVSEGEKVEFINGEIVHHLPVRLRHNAVNGRLLNLLGNYVRNHDLGFVG